MEYITQAEMDALATKANSVLLPIVNNASNIAFNEGFGYGVAYDKFTDLEVFEWVNPQPNYSFTQATYANLIPPTATYGSDGHYTATIATAGDYIYQSALNDSSFITPGGSQFSGTLNNFYLAEGILTLVGTPNTKVTAKLFLSPFNWLYEMNRIWSDAMNFVLSIEAPPYEGISGINMNPAAVCSGPWIVGVNDSVAFPLSLLPVADGIVAGISNFPGWLEGVLQASYTQNGGNFTIFNTVKFYSQSNAAAVDTCRYYAGEIPHDIACVSGVAGTWNAQIVYYVTGATLPTLADFTFGGSSTVTITWAVQNTAIAGNYLLVGTIAEAIGAGTQTLNYTITPAAGWEIGNGSLGIILSKLIFSTANTPVVANCVCPDGASFVYACADMPADSDFTINGAFSMAAWILENPAIQGVWSAITLPVPAINCFCDQDLPPYVAGVAQLETFEYDEGVPSANTVAFAGNYEAAALLPPPATNPTASSMRQAGPTTLSTKGADKNINPLIPSLTTRATKWLARRDTDFVPFDLGFNAAFGGYGYNIETNQVADSAGDLVNLPVTAIPPTAVKIVIRLVAPGTIPGWYGGVFKYGEPLATDLTIYVKANAQPTVTEFDFKTTNNAVTIPTDGGAGYLAGILNGGLGIAVQSPDGQSVNFDAYIELDNSAPARIYTPPCGECFSYCLDGTPAPIVNISPAEIGSYFSKPIPQSGYCIFNLRATVLSTPNESGIYTLIPVTEPITVTVGQNVLNAGNLVFQSLGITLTIPADAATSGDVNCFIPVLAGNEIVYQCDQKITLEAFVNWQPVFFNSFYGMGQFPLSNNNEGPDVFFIPSPTVFTSALAFVNQFFVGAAGWVSPRGTENAPMVVFPLFKELYDDTVKLLNLI